MGCGASVPQTSGTVGDAFTFTTREQLIAGHVSSNLHARSVDAPFQHQYILKHGEEDGEDIDDLVEFAVLFQGKVQYWLEGVKMQEIAIENDGVAAKIGSIIPKTRIYVTDTEKARESGVAKTEVTVDSRYVRPKMPAHQSPEDMEVDRSVGNDPFGKQYAKLREDVAKKLEDSKHIKSAKRLSKELRENNTKNNTAKNSTGKLSENGSPRLTDGVQDDDEKLGISYIPNKHNLMEWRVALLGPENSPYENHIFMLIVNFENRLSGESKYPFEPPKIHFTTPMFHPNISQRGKICLNILNDASEWTPMMSVESLMLSIRLLLQAPNTSDPLNVHASNMLDKNPNDFRKRARETAQKYATRYENHSQNPHASTNLNEQLQRAVAEGKANPLVMVNTQSASARQQRIHAERAKATNVRNRTGSNRGPLMDKTNIEQTNIDGDEFADFQTDSIGRVLTEEEAERRLRWAGALEKYQAARAAKGLS